MIKNISRPYASGAGDPWASEIEQPAIPHERPPVKYEPWTACLHLRPPGLPLTSSQPPSGISAAVGANDGTEESDEETDSEECRVEARNRYSQYVRGIGPTDDKKPVDWKRVEVLNKKVPQWANCTVNSQSLTREYEMKDKDGVTRKYNFVSYYRNRSLIEEHRFKEIIGLQGLWDESGVWDSIPDLDVLGRELPKLEWREKWCNNKTAATGAIPYVEAIQKFFHHLFAKHAGEVAIVENREPEILKAVDKTWSTCYFHPQFAIKATHRKRWEKAGYHNLSAAGEKLTAGQAAEIGATTFLTFSEDGETGECNVATVISLQQLFVLGYKEFTARELYYYYNNCCKIVNALSDCQTLSADKQLVGIA